MFHFRSLSGTIPLFALVASICLPSSALAQDDVTICRGPGFYQTHSGQEKDAPNIAQEIIDAVDGFDVCGHHIVTTDDLGGLDSALEALCVRTQGVDQRQLYRQLTTAKLNCLMSEGADCDEITGRFIDVSYSDCDALCDGQPSMDGPTEQECIDQLACFNGGGRIIEGECAKGTCDDDSLTYCEKDEDCGEEGDCVRFEDSCANSQFCSEDLDSPAQICPKKGPATSPKTCRDARKNGCTVDDITCYEACYDYEPCVAACEATPGCDPTYTCQGAEACFDTCWYQGFGDQTPCGCEYSWNVFCYYITPGEAEYFECLYAYPEAEGNGFCTECGDDPYNCLN